MLVNYGTHLSDLFTHCIYLFVAKRAYFGGGVGVITGSGVPRNFVRLGVQQI